MAGLYERKWKENSDCWNDNYNERTCRADELEKKKKKMKTSKEQKTNPKHSNSKIEMTFRGPLF